MLFSYSQVLGIIFWTAKPRGTSYNLDYQCYNYKHHSGSLKVIDSQNGDLLLREISTENLIVLPADGCSCHLPLSATSCWQMQPQQHCTNCVVYNSQYFVFAIIFECLFNTFLSSSGYKMHLQINIHCRHHQSLTFI